MYHDRKVGPCFGCPETLFSGYDFMISDECNKYANSTCDFPNKFNKSDIFKYSKGHTTNIKFTG